MARKIQIKNLSDLFQEIEPPDDTKRLIACSTLDEDTISSHFSSPIYLNSFTALLVLSGSGELHINYKPYRVEKETIVLLSVSHLFNFIACTTDFKCLCLFVSKDFMEKMDATDMIYRRIKYGARLYNTPLVKLSKTKSAVLTSRMSAIDQAIKNSTHFYYKEMILNSLFAFYLDLSNFIEQDSTYSGSNLTRYESIIGLFIELLVANFRKEHKVDFYASHLNITPHYLTLIVKRITGQTVNEFIFEMLYSEARNLLTHSKLSIQEIASLLYFSDQSTFGKFFKRKSGMSPIEFRKRDR